MVVVVTTSTTGDEPVVLPARNRSARRDRIASKIVSNRVPVCSVVAGLLLWEVLGRFVLTNTLFFVPLSRVLTTLADMARSGELGHHVAVSGIEFGIGFGISAVAGIALGFFMGVSRTVRGALDPWVNALYATPLVALMPLFLIVFGIGTAGKAALVVTVAVFPILINTAVGVTTTDNAFLEVARAYGASRWATFRKVYLPACLPHIVAGLRLGMGRGLTGVVVGEFFFANAGLGYLVARAGQSFDSPTLFAAILVLTAIAVCLNQLLRTLERRLARWRENA